MALNLSILVRNARLNAIETIVGTASKLKIFSGAKPTACADADPSGLLATITCPSDWWADASGGVKAIANGPWAFSGSGDGVALSFRLYATDGTTCGLQGTVGQGSGDLQLDNTNIATTQAGSITAFSITDGNA